MGAQAGLPLADGASSPPTGDAVCPENPDQPPCRAEALREGRSSVPASPALRMRDITSDRFYLVKMSGIEAPLYSGFAW